MFTNFIHNFIKHQRSIFLFLAFTVMFFSAAAQVKKENEVSYKIRTVVIDPGHGGKDPGAVRGKDYEKDIVLKIALLLGHYIDSLIPDVKVVYTRDDDTFIELHKRAKIANDCKADLFISLHVNANKSDKPVGAETYVMGLHKSEGNLDVAKLENSVILAEDDFEAQYDGFDPNSSEGYIVFSLLQNVFLEQSLSFSAKIQEQFRDRAGRIDRGVKQAGFLVLWKTTMPSILIECGFLSNEEESKYLLSKTGQDYLASAIFRAFRDYKNEMEGIAPTKGTSEKIDNQENKKENKQEEQHVIKESKAEVIKQEKTDKPKEPAQDTENKDTMNVVVKNTELDRAKANKLDNILYSGIRFRIQITSSENLIELSPENFNGLSEISYIIENERYKYLSGNFSSFDKAVLYQKEAREKYPDAFMVAFKNGEKIPLKDAINK